MLCQKPVERTEPGHSAVKIVLVAMPVQPCAVRSLTACWPAAASCE